jgi:hypothetical protein
MKMIRRLISLAARLCCSLTPSSRDTHAGSAHQGKLLAATEESSMQVPNGPSKTMKMGISYPRYCCAFEVLFEFDRF